MICAWDAYLGILPGWMRSDVDRLGKADLQELRLRVGSPPLLCLYGRNMRLKGEVHREDLNFVIQTASRYSPWAAATMAKGFLTAPGGHRIGICGEAVSQNGVMTGIRNPASVCIRAARQFPDIAKEADALGSVLIIGSPGSGKTTLLRDLIRLRSNNGGGSISVVDERGELFPVVNGTSCFDPGQNTDILTGCTKSAGIECVLRTMGPCAIAVDEITAEEDCSALLRAAWCGVKLLATAHASGKADLLKRPVYRSLVQKELFDTLITMQPDLSWKTERMDVCLSSF